MDLNIRLNILKNAGQISEENYEKIILIIKHFKEEIGIELTEENGAMFITHLSSALSRIEKNELVNKIDDCIFNEVKNDINYIKTVEIVKTIEKLIGIFPNEERDFIEMHICTLLNK